MPVWQKAATAMEEAYKLADKLPGHEKYAMATQIRTAALSIPGNIAEAFGRQHKKDKQNFTTIAADLRMKLLAICTAPLR